MKAKRSSKNGMRESRWYLQLIQIAPIWHQKYLGTFTRHLSKMEELDASIDVCGRLLDAIKDGTSSFLSSPFIEIGGEML